LQINREPHMNPNEKFSLGRPAVWPARPNGSSCKSRLGEMMDGKTPLP
jgi:hypothetical protein